MANLGTLYFSWVVPLLLCSANVLSLPLPSDIGLTPSPSFVDHASSVHKAATTSAPADHSHAPGPVELGVGIGIACFCSVASLLGLCLFWRRPQLQPQPYRKHVPLRSRLRQAFSTLLLRIRRRFTKSSRDDYTLGTSWLPNSYPERPRRLPSRVNSLSRTWRIPAPSPDSTAPLVRPKVVSIVGIAELSSSPVSEFFETIETHPIPTFLLPPSPTHLAPCPAFQDEACISRFSVTTLDTASVGLPASRTSMVTAGSTNLQVQSAGQDFGEKRALRASIATIATTSTSLTIPVPSSQLRLAAQATLIRTPERAARLVSLRRVSSEGVCRVSSEKLQRVTSKVARREGDVVEEAEEDGDSVLEETNSESSECRTLSEDDDEEWETTDADITSDEEAETQTVREGWGRQSRWISRSTSLPEVKRYIFAPDRARTW